MVQVFESFVAIVFFIEVNKVCSSSSLAIAGAVSGKVTSLATFETSIVSISPWWPSGVVSGCWSKASGISLYTSLIARLPVWSSGVT